MKYCKLCLMPDTRPGIQFDQNGVCFPCLNFEKSKSTNWNERFLDLKKLCDKYRGSNGNGYDCAVAVSGGKDSHFQVYYLKEVLKMNPVLLTVGNIDWTETGRKNLANLSDVFGCEIIQINSNIDATRKLTKKAFVELGQPSWYLDSMIYSYPYRMSMNLGIKLLVYGENVNYAYGGIQNKETPSAMLQPFNDVVKPYSKEWLDELNLSEKDLDSTIPPTPEECKKSKLDPIYLSYFLPWSSHHNYELASRWGFQHLSHEHMREGFLENYDQIDSLSYLMNIHMKYPKFAHASATDIASRWIRYGLKTRQEMIPLVEEIDGKLDQEVKSKFCDFIRIGPKEFTEILDKWYNPNFFEQDNEGLWHPKFKVGKGLLK